MEYIFVFTNVNLQKMALSIEKNIFGKQFLEYYSAFFACKLHKVVKITVPYIIPANIKEKRRADDIQATA